MNELQEFCQNHKGRILRKWTHYFNIYDRYFNKFRGKSPVIIEIGVFKGGSLQMWKSYFGSGARIIGIDIDPACKQFEEQGIEIYIGSQGDRAFLTSLMSKIPNPDIILDDGGHLVSQQIKCFNILFPYLKTGGIYMCEDVHTSYWLKYGGGYKRIGTFIEYMKHQIDALHSWHHKHKESQGNFVRDSVYGISFYDSIVVLEKEKIDTPEEKWYGVQVQQSNNQTLKWWKKIPVHILDVINKLLQFLHLPSIYYGR